MDAVAPARARGLARLADVRPGEGGPLALAFAYFFSLLCGYYLLRPLREEMGIRGGVDKLDRVFLLTFLTMLAAVPLAGWLFARVPRGRAIPVLYGFFTLHLVLFAGVFAGGGATWAPHTFFVWVSVYNLFVTSVFWSFMADLFTSEQGKRLFGLVASGGSAGALAGPALAALLVRPLGIPGIILLSAVFLAIAAGCAAALARRAALASARVRHEGGGVGGSPFAGFTAVARSPYLAALALQILCVSCTTTFIYFAQARIVAATFTDPARRTQVFAGVDLAVSVLSLLLQAAVTGPVLASGGLAVGLALHPLLTAAGILAMAASPTLAVLALVQGLRRSVHYAIERPAREVLFTVVGREDRYKAKGFLDTVVYRGGDAASARLSAMLTQAGVGVAGAQLAALPVVALWLAVVLWLARRHARLERS